jgi:hypothetical protein
MQIFVSLLFLPFLTVPALMDERYWFLQGSAIMNFSASNILSYGASFHQPGRYMPLSGYLRSIHSYFGFEIMTGFGIPLSIFQGLVHAFFLSVTFLALYWYLINIPFREKDHTKYLDKKLAIQLTLATAFVFAGMASIRWQHNGLVAYVPMTFLPLITALLLATIARKLLISHKLRSDKKLIIKLLCLSVLVSLWTNLFYELAYVCVVLVVIACAQEFLHSRDSRERKISIFHLSLYTLTFLIYWLPMRIHLANECASIKCYDGSQVSIAGAWDTFILNLINPLPLVGPYVDFKANALISELSAFAIFVIVVIVIGANLVTFINLRASRATTKTSESQSHLDVNFDRILDLVIGPISIGIVSALLMSVSIRSQKLVELGNPYRHAPILWLGYSLILSTLLVWAFNRYSRNTMAMIMAVVSVIMVIQQISSVNNSLVLQRSQTIVLKIYDELIFPDFSEQGNERRCSLKESITRELDIKTYIEPSSAYFAKKLDYPYCK